MPRTVKRADMILFFLPVIAGIVLAVGRRMYGEAAGGGMVRVYSDGRLVAERALSDDATFSVRADGEVYEDARPGETEYNIIVIRDGTCAVIDADCPDGICIRRGRISRRGESIVCLPHKLVAEIAGGEEPEVDTVAQ